MKGTILLALVALFVGLSAALKPIPKEMDMTYSRMHELMLMEFGTSPPPVEPQDFELHMIPMRDGVKLRTRIWIPNDITPGTTTAAILDRTPYGPAYTAMSLIWSFDGYVIVMQDQRGTFGSGGNFEIWRMDGQDAYDTCEWIAQQSWSNGKVFSFGVSADANSVYPQILYNNPWLHAHFPVFGADNGHALCYPGGVYLQNLIERWLDSVCDDCISMVTENEMDGPFWDPINMTSHYGNVHFPSIHWAGWYDIFLEHQINAFNGYYKQGQAAYRPDTYLFIEPHGHCYDVVYLKGVSLLGLRLGRKIFQLQNTGVRDPLLDEVKNLNLYIMGPQEIGPLVPGNYYTSLDDWPAYEATNYFLHPEGTLQTLSPFNSSSFSYKYDPEDPAETYGGNNLFGTCGGLDQSAIEARSDYLTFTTDSLIRDVAVVGPIKAVLFVSSSTNDTDFLVKVTDVYPDGRSILITEGSTRMRWLGDKRSPAVSIIPGVVYEIEVSIWRTGMIFARGHSIRVSITSSNSPRYEANPNNGGPVANTGAKVVTQNTVYVGKEHPSRLVLPVVDQSDIPPVTFKF